MDRSSGRLVEQLHNAQARHRKVTQQLQIENARRVTDLADVRHERDAFRKEVARIRKENAELLSRFEEVLTECQDLKREKATLVRALVVGDHYQGHARSAPMGLKTSKTLSVLTEKQLTSPETSESGTTPSAERVSFQELEKYLERDLPDPPKPDSPPPDRPPYRVVSSVCDDTQGGRMRRTTVCRSDSPLLAGDNAMASGRGWSKVATLH